MKAVFIELSSFHRQRESYLDDDGYRALQVAMMQNPEAGDVIEGAGGLRKMRYADTRRGKGKRGGLRVIYYWDGGQQFWLFTLYDKNELDDMTAKEKQVFRTALKDLLAPLRNES